jgi:hypothetical protein
MQIILKFPDVFTSVLADEEVKAALGIKLPEKPALPMVEAVRLYFKLAISIRQWNTLTKTINTQVPQVYGLLPSYTRMRRWCVSA